MIDYWSMRIEFIINPYYFLTEKHWNEKRKSCARCHNLSRKQIKLDNNVMVMHPAQETWTRYKF